MTHVNADGLVVGPTRQAHRSSRERKADMLPYRSRNRPPVSWILFIDFEVFVFCNFARTGVQFFVLTDTFTLIFFFN